jgi:hypothetical protein
MLATMLGLHASTMRALLHLPRDAQFQTKDCWYRDLKWFDLISSTALATSSIHNQDTSSIHNQDIPSNN